MTVQRVTTILEVVGLVAVTSGAALVAVPVGLIVGGGALVLVGAMLGRRP